MVFPRSLRAFLVRKKKTENQTYSVLGERGTRYASFMPLIDVFHGTNPGRRNNAETGRKVQRGRARNKPRFAARSTDVFVANLVAKRAHTPTPLHTCTRRAGEIFWQTRMRQPEEWRNHVEPQSVMPPGNYSA